MYKHQFLSYMLYLTIYQAFLKVARKRKILLERNYRPVGRKYLIFITTIHV